ALRALSLENPMRRPISSCDMPLSSAARRILSRTVMIESGVARAVAIQAVYTSVGRKSMWKEVLRRCWLPIWIVGAGGLVHVFLAHFKHLFLDLLIERL